MAITGKLITFLGNNGYSVHDHGGAKGCIYIQEALIKKHRQQIEEVVVLATPEAKELNWEPKENNSNLSLKSALDKIKQENNLDFSYKLIEISEVQNEGQLWEIFNSLAEEFDEGDQVYLDLSYASSYQTLLLMNVLNYLKVLKKVKLKSIEYGLTDSSKLYFSSLPKAGEQMPILDLTSFDYLREWALAVDNFCTTGTFNKFEQIFDIELEELRADDNDFFKNLKQLMADLRAFDLNLKSCRGQELNDILLSIMDNLEQLSTNQSLNQQSFSHYLKLINKIKHKFNSFFTGPESEIKNHLQILNWCLEHGLIQQGWTILLESLVTVVIKDTEYDYQEQEIRLDFKKALSYLHKSFQAQREGYKLTPLGLMNDKYVFDEAVKVIKDNYPEFPRLYNKLHKAKKDVDQFGMHKNYEKPEDLKKYLSQYIDELEKIYKKKLRVLS